MRSPAGVSFFSSGLANGPPNVESPVAVCQGTSRSAVFFLTVIGKTEEACSGGGSGVLLFRIRRILVFGGSPKNPPVVWGTGVNVPDVSGFWVLLNNPPPNAGVVIEVDVEVAALSANLGEARRIHQAQGWLSLSL